MMKKLFIYLLLFSNIVYLNAQEWVRQHPFEVFESLQAITFGDQGNGWAVGGNSTILRTDNWGVDWVSITPIDLGVSLLSVEIVPNTNGQHILIGGNTFLQSTDGGENWERIFGFSNPIDQILAVDPQNIFAFGYNDTSKKSTDGGETWVEFPNPTTSGTMLGSFLDPMNGWASGGTYENAQLYGTTDGGENWTLLDTTKHVLIEGIEMLDAQEGFMASRDHILKTVDGGNTWVIISDQDLSSVTDMHVVNDQEIWVAANNGAAYFTLNGGNTWSLVYPDVFSGNRANGIHALSGGQCWMAGKYSSILYTANTGQTWQDQTEGKKNRLENIIFFDDNHGYAAGARGTLLKTINGGAIWEDISIPTTERIINIGVTSPQTIYILTSEDGIQKSIDSGENWTSLSDHMISNPYDMRVISDQHICLSGRYGNISTTTNDGINWTTVDYPEYITKETSFPSENIGWMASNQGSLLKTTDGGLNWVPVPVDNATSDVEFNAVHFVDQMEGWAIGYYVDSLFHTGDGGNSWEVQHLPQPTYWQEISFMDRDTGWIAGGSSGHSKIMHTTDGGENWEQVYSDVASFSGITSLSSNKAWAAGSGGSIMHFSPCNAQAALSNLSGDQQLCQGDTVQYQVNSENVVIFDWQLPEDWIFLGNSNTSLVEVVVGAIAGNVQITGQNSCGIASQPLALAVAVDDTNEVNLTANNATLEVSTTGTSYSWYLNGEVIHESTNNTFTAPQNGLYHVVVTFNTGCNATSDIVNVMITDTEQLNIEQRILVFPNPANDYIQIDYPASLQEVNIRLLNTQGKVLFNGKYDLQTSLDTSSYPAGMYSIEITTKNSIFYKKLLLL